MLAHLSISNYALIGSLELEPGSGMNIITGETGAGKSILLGALGLILGERADTQSLRDKTKKCIVEARFRINDYSMQELFRELGLDYEEVSIIRREINPEGKSRAFVNDTPVNLQTLKSIGNRLVDVHSQHETLLINNTRFQVTLLDLVAGNEKLFTDYSASYADYRNLATRLCSLEEAESNASKEQDYLQFQFNELNDARLEEGEEQKLEQELSALENAEGIGNAVQQASAALSGDEGNIISALNGLRSLLSPYAKFNAKLNELLNRINSSAIELKDISAELDETGQEIQPNPERKQIVEERLDLINRLQQKHRVQDISGLIQIRDELQNKLGAFQSLSSEILETKKALEAKQEHIRSSGKKLFAQRKKHAPVLENEILEIMHDLSIPHASFIVQLKELSEPGPLGLNTVEFLFSANRGIDPREISQVASGGELSRLMLALKSVIARLSSLPTIIFDEIDSGVSGMVAGKVAGIMERMGKNMQVITITHLPQVASKGGTHFFVYKETEEKQTATKIRKLNKQERIHEIARMLSAGEPGKAALSNARELLEKNG